MSECSREKISDIESGRASECARERVRAWASRWERVRDSAWERTIERQKRAQRKRESVCRREIVNA